MADTLLVLVPHEHTHAPRSILEQARKLGPDDMCKALPPWAVWGDTDFPRPAHETKAVQSPEILVKLRLVWYCLGILHPSNRCSKAPLWPGDDIRVKGLHLKYQ